MKMHFSAKFSSIRSFSALAGPPVQERRRSASCGKELCAVWGGLHSLGQSSDALSLRDTHKTRPKQQNGTKPACSQSVEPRKVPSKPEMLEKYIFVLIFNAVWAEEGG